MAIIALTLKRDPNDARQHALSPLHLVAGSFSFEAAHDGNGTRVWQGPSAHQHAKRCPADGTMDAGITDEHVWIVEESWQVIAKLLQAVGEGPVSADILARCPDWEGETTPHPHRPPMVVGHHVPEKGDAVTRADSLALRLFFRRTSRPALLQDALWDMLNKREAPPDFRGELAEDTEKERRLLWRWEGPDGQQARGIAQMLHPNDYPLFRLLVCRFRRKGELFPGQAALLHKAADLNEGSGGGDHGEC